MPRIRIIVAAVAVCALLCLVAAVALGAKRP